MDYWLHRIGWKQEVSYPLLDNGYLSIGFSDFANKQFLDKTTNADWDYFESQFDEIWGERSRNRHQLWRFIADMDEGDWVIVPSWGVFSIYEICTPEAELIGNVELPKNFLAWGDHKVETTGNTLQFAEGKEAIDLGFIRRVKLIAGNIPRHDYADAALTSRMKCRQTNINILDLKDSITNALASFKKGEPINLKSELHNAASAVWLEKIRSKLNDRKFENLIRWYFERIGASAVDIPPKNEADKSGDVDIIAIFDSIKTIIYVQAKHYTGTASDWAVQQIADFAVSQNKNKAKSGDLQSRDRGDDYQTQYWVIASADDFSDGCKKLASSENVQLINGKQFVELLVDAGISTLGDM